jgi:hypothetical protein
MQRSEARLYYDSLSCCTPDVSRFSPIHTTIMIHDPCMLRKMIDTVVQAVWWRAVWTCCQCREDSGEATSSTGGETF